MDIFSSELHLHGLPVLTHFIVQLLDFPRSFWRKSTRIHKALGTEAPSRLTWRKSRPSNSQAIRWPQPLRCQLLIETLQRDLGGQLAHASCEAEQTHVHEHARLLEQDPASRAGRREFQDHGARIAHTQ